MKKSFYTTFAPLVLQLLNPENSYTANGFSRLPSVVTPKFMNLCRSKAIRYSPGEDKEEMPSWLLDTAARRARLVREEESRERFATGQELMNLREDLAALEENLKWSLASDDPVRICQLTEAIEKGKNRDPEYVYVKALEQLKKAETSLKITKKYDRISFYTKEAAAARAYIPRLNLDGLWIGKFGEHGSELINITYSGDTLVARKATGDKHVPRGEISFTVDLSPDAVSNSTALSPIELSETAASVWGTSSLPRYPGKGQIASKGFRNSRFVDGQLIMFDGYFSFLWNPTKQNIFFTRPSMEVIFEMLRDVVSEEDEVENMRDHVTRCFNKDISEAFSVPENDRVVAPFKRILRKADIDASLQDKISKYSDEDIPSQMKKWMTYIDQVLKEGKGSDNTKQ